MEPLLGGDGAGGKRRVVGLMSGTAADGVDAALVETDGEAAIRLLATASRPYAAAERALLRTAARAALALDRPRPDPLVAEAERLLTQAHAEAVRALPGWEEAELVGFHGATVAHRPDRGFTWQIGDARWLARELGRPVVHDFRSADVAAGGEGAPLAPGFHRALAAGLARPLGILNVGGVANLTWLADGAWGAFDTGPGNALLDDWVREHGAGSCDRDGTISAAGRVREDVLTAMLDNPWFDRMGPRSLDRDDFTLQPVRGLPLADGAATLVAFTAEAVALALAGLPVRLGRLLVTGGGRCNPTLMRALARHTGLAVEPIEAIGADGDSLEAQAFAWLAVRVVRGLPTSWPETTGVRWPVCGGRVALPD
ncbi:MAG: anhydro-N-acetylmuramic acid kinase [Sphingomonadaceae bacterium]|uniref:anhydro-N-acetylmuramic acid kinase n=1 Tax=Thermaurantiacus sp. TaxID=2820283 RepID=UPI00298EFD04|nr:anhydro-N-acetylmuramic acid kinase [Thermaurantiacus sp.]MCS6986167.1 anhydro-N-acetylmuramic acid kinase [Sphingomonadaceae bacterium]